MACMKALLVRFRIENPLKRMNFQHLSAAPAVAGIHEGTPVAPLNTDNTLQLV